MHNESAKSETPNSRLSLIRGIIPVPVITVKLQCNALHQREIHIAALSPESQKHRQRVSNADRKVFANPEIFCDKVIIG